MTKKKRQMRKRPEKAGQLHTRWSGLDSVVTPGGQRFKRFYTLETLRRALDFALAGKGNDTFVRPALAQLLTGGAISLAEFQPAYEDHYRFVLRATVSTQRRRQGVGALVVAKNDAEFSTLVEVEFGHLKQLAQRAPGLVAVPLRAGAIALPDRHARSGRVRLVSAYLRKTLDDAQPLGVAPGGQFTLAALRPHRFSVADTEHLKARLAELVLRAFDPAAGTMPDLDALEPTDFLVTRAKEARPKLKLAACRHMRSRQTPAACFAALLNAKWPAGQTRTHLVPQDPDLLVPALARAVGKTTAARWAGEYLAAVAAKKAPPCRSDYLDALEHFVVK